MHVPTVFLISQLFKGELDHYSCALSVCRIENYATYTSLLTVNIKFNI